MTSDERESLKRQLVEAARKNPDMSARLLGVRYGVSTTSAQRWLAESGLGRPAGASMHET